MSWRIRGFSQGVSEVDNKGDRGGDNPGDSQGDRGSDNLKSPSEKENDKNLEVTNKENEIKLDSSYENPPTVF